MRGKARPKGGGEEVTGGEQSSYASSGLAKRGIGPADGVPPARGEGGEGASHVTHEVSLATCL